MYVFLNQNKVCLRGGGGGGGERDMFLSITYDSFHTIKKICLALEVFFATEEPLNVDSLHEQF